MHFAPELMAAVDEARRSSVVLKGEGRARVSFFVGDPSAGYQDAAALNRDFAGRTRTSPREEFERFRASWYAHPVGGGPPMTTGAGRAEADDGWLSMGEGV